MVKITIIKKIKIANSLELKYLGFKERLELRAKTAFFFNTLLAKK